MTAMEKKMESLRTHDVWDLVELPRDREAVGSKGYTSLRRTPMDQSNGTKLDF